VSTIKVDTVQSTGGGAVTLTNQEAFKHLLHFNHQTPAIIKSWNTASVTDTAVGAYAASITTAYADINYIMTNSNNFKVINFAAEPASSGTPYVIYTAASGTTAVVLGLILTNINTSQVTTTVRLVSDTANRAVTNNTANGTSLLVKDAPIPVGGSLEILTGSKVILETTDQLTVDCSVADKLSGTLSVMEIT